MRTSLCYIIVLHRHFKPIQAHRMSIDNYPALVERQQLAAPPVPRLPQPQPHTALPTWRRRYLQPGAMRLNSGPYPLYAPETVAHWPVMVRGEETV